MDQTIYNLIKECSQNSKLALNIENNQLLATKKGKKTDYKTLHAYITQKQISIKEAFLAAYKDGIDCTNFQNQINHIYAKAGLEQGPHTNLLKEYTRQWMKNLPDKNRKLNEILLPGTHDSGAYKISYECPGYIKSRFFKFLYKSFVTIFSPIIKNWSVTQEKSIQEQLESGIRMLDLRLGKDDKNNLYISHLVLTEKLEDIFQQIKEFTQKNPNEVVVINFKIDKPFRKYITNDDMKRAGQLVDKYFGEIALRANEEIGTLNEMVANNRKIVFNTKLKEHQVDAMGVDNASLVRNNKSHEVWPNATSEEKVMNKLLKNKLNDIKDKRQKKDMVYVSLNTTPDAKEVAYGVCKFQNLTDRGQKIQQKLPALLNDERMKGASGIILDAPTNRSIQGIINNHEKASHSEKQKNNAQNTPSSMKLGG